MIVLEVIPKDAPPFETTLTSHEIVVGRSNEADIVVADRYLSRKHALLKYEDGCWHVEDLGSNNGTKVNGKRIRKATALRRGDRVELSRSALVIRDMDIGGTSPTTGSAFSETVFLPASEMLLDQPALADVAGEESLRRHAERFRLLNEVHQALAGPMDLGALLKLILDKVFDHLKPEEAVILLKNADGVFERVAQRRAEGWTEDYLYSETLIEEVAVKGMAARVVDLRSDDRFSGAESIALAGVLSLMAVPLMTSEESLGMIAVNSRLETRHFTDNDLELLNALASVAAIRIRNHRLTEDAVERRRLEAELALARKIQVGLQPKVLPSVPGYLIDAGSVPSRGVSGDFYTCVEREGICVVGVADVSGKGMAASLLTATTEALAAVSIAEGQPPERVFRRVNDLLVERTPAEKFVTAFLAFLEPPSGKVTWANAGHNPTLLVRSGGTVETLGATGLPLGLMGGAAYTAGESVLEPGDSLVLYSDGITEAENPEEEEYGMARLQEVCLRHAADPAGWLDAVEADLEAFVRGVPYADDRTVVVVHRRPAD